MIQGQAEASADAPRIRDAFPLAFFPPGLSPLCLQYQLHLPELAPPIPPARKMCGFLLAFYLRVPPSSVSVAWPSMPHKVEACPVPVCSFSLQNPWVIVVGSTRGRVGGQVFLLPRVVTVTSGRVVL